MRVEISEYAAQQLDDIWVYYALEVSVPLADRITAKILDDIERLCDHPGGGQFEPLLQHLGLQHRRLVSGNYKILYRINGDVIFVSDIFDTRQDPEKMAW